MRTRPLRAMHEGIAALHPPAACMRASSLLVVLLYLLAFCSPVSTTPSLSFDSSSGTVLDPYVCCVNCDDAPSPYICNLPYYSLSLHKTICACVLNCLSVPTPMHIFSHKSLDHFGSQSYGHKTTVLSRIHFIGHS